ncbi:Galactose oxidase/kelch repeat superfamily protein, putative isoform 2 [Hibiscus syriacus]|uniref:Galactose oxidase/kelch repeat superfamily protein, putative isoform 2 n=1 Tax=Hibiscus syriacus TaxID=106335 RepID=A0A6A2YZC0_HIBSY|nr:acyl-CoA-binding domain-containing protein 4-like isoform X2 [Hibiscus syriacus]KAE8684252.1 Galactose oxidase/kelch repeat superfamily protein, putative isoform 2 [Hibiscus syriacus]
MQTTMEYFGAQMAKRKAMWLYPKVSGFNPSERWGHSACYSNGVVYVFGGCCGGLHLSDVLMLNLNTMVWKTMETTGQGPGPRDSHSVALVGTKMMVFGGTNGSRKVNDLHVLDLMSKEWTRAECNGAAPSPRESHTATLIGDDKVVIFGGSGEGGANYLCDLHVLDLRTMRWTSPQVRGHIPVPRDSHSAVAIGNKLVVYGGDCGDRYHGDVDIFDMDTSTWSRLAVQGSLPGVRAGHAAVTIGAKVFVIGGVGDKHYYNDVWVLDLNACRWTQLYICGQQPQGRFSHTAVLAESDVAIYGGCGEDERPINELLVLQLGTQHPNGRYNISMCKAFGGHWNQEKRRFLGVAPSNSKGICFADLEVSKHGDNEREQEAKHSSRLGSDTSNPKRRRTANTKACEVESEQEEHSLSLSQHSSPSHSDQEQGAALKPPDSTASHGLNLLKQLHPIPSGCQINNDSNNHKQTGYVIHKTREGLQYTREFRNLQKPEQYLHAVHTGRQRSGVQCSAVEPRYFEAGPTHNLLGAEVHGKVDGAFDSGLLVTATVNGKIFRGVLFAPGSPGVVSRGPMLAPSPSSTRQAGAAQPVLNPTNLEPLKPSQSPTMHIMRESGHSTRHLATNGASLAAKHPKLRSDLGDVVLTLGGPGTGPV